MGEIYRVPSANEEESIMKFARILESLPNGNNNIIIGTDQNFDLLKLNSHANTYCYMAHGLHVGGLPLLLDGA